MGDSRMHSMARNIGRSRPGCNQAVRCMTFFGAWRVRGEVDGGHSTRRQCRSNVGVVEPQRGYEGGGTAGL
ncbi:hypothetical protein C4J84_2737 [Pseudomonas sp. R11-23-07]|nr:hypothetical protein C4J86_2874 [Pseudomonas sp. R2-7-07]AZF58612.1 hypothetical protein C4J84_2737 [Pseudomonas sp. R11-23-07]